MNEDIHTLPNTHLSRYVTKITAPKFFPMKRLAVFMLNQIVLKKPSAVYLPEVPEAAPSSTSSTPSTTPISPSPSPQPTSATTSTATSTTTTSSGAPLPTHLPPTTQISASPSPSTKPRQFPDDFLEYLCNDKVMPPEITLQTIRTYHWKSSDELLLTYRVSPKYLAVNQPASNQSR